MRKTTEEQSRRQPQHALLPDDPDTLLLPCNKVLGQRLKNHHGEVIGRLCSIVLDLKTGRISYGVLAYALSFGSQPRLFAMPWHALVLDQDGKSFSVEVEISDLKRLPGFDPSFWPGEADASWQRKINGFYSSN